jgi:hypothetical protein
VAAGSSPDIRLHDFCHTVVSMLMEMGGQPHVVQAIARHAHVKITLKVAANRVCAGQNGGRGRFRTYDPSLVRRVLSH